MAGAARLAGFDDLVRAAAAAADGSGTRALHEFGYACLDRGVGHLAIRLLACTLEKDTFISIGSSRSAVPLLRVPHRLVEIEGAQHGSTVHDDPQYLNPQSQEWQAFAIQTIADWVTADAVGAALGYASITPAGRPCCRQWPGAGRRHSSQPRRTTTPSAPAWR